MFVERLVLATGSRGKYREFAAMLPREVVGELIFAPKMAQIEVEETGTCYAENARLKAQAWAWATGLPSLADDSGLEVDILGGAPGVLSARIVPGPDQARNDWLLSRLEGRLDRRARFVAALALAIPDRWTLIVEGECPGRIATAPEGKGGFGYDPLFLPDGLNASFAAIPPEMKNAISHRAAALRNLLEILMQ